MEWKNITESTPTPEDEEKEFIVIDVNGNKNFAFWMPRFWPKGEHWFKHRNGGWFDNDIRFFCPMIPDPK